MQVAVACKVRRPQVFAETITLTPTSSDFFENEFLFDMNPISVDDKVTFNKDMMIEKQWYPFSYKGKEYLAVKASKNTIDIYRIKK